MKKLKGKRLKEISLADIYQLEHYLFKLYEFLGSKEYVELKDTNAINEEINFIIHSISILKQLLDIDNEIKYVAWRKDDNHELITLYCFRSVEVACLVTGLDPTTIKLTTKALADLHSGISSFENDIKKWSRLGWYIKNASDCQDFLIKDDSYTQYLKVKYGKAEIVTPNGNV